MHDEDATSKRLDVLAKLTERAFDSGQWKRVKRYASEGVAKADGSHWFWDRLGVATTELGLFSEASAAFRQGLAIMPSCPLLLCGYADLHFAQGRELEGLEILRPVIHGSLNSLLSHPCSEGIRASRGLYLNALSDAGIAAFKLRRYDLAAKYFKRHLAQRQRGTPTTHSKLAMQRALAATLARRAQIKKAPKSTR